MKWGIYDTKDKCWLGNQKGPFLSRFKWFAEAQAMVFNKKSGLESRFEHREFTEDMAKGRASGSITLSKLKAENQKRG